MISYLNRYRKKFLPQNLSGDSISENQSNFNVPFYKIMLNTNQQRDLVDYNYLVRSLDHEDDYKLYESKHSEKKWMSLS